MKKTIVVLFSLCLGLLAILAIKIERRMRMEVLDIRPPQLTFRAARQMFPFSVIPGGLQDTRELADSIAKDDLVREHYKDLKPEQMWFTRVKEPMVAYVSYRKDGKVRWTNRPVTIASNELVLTDGKNLVRARCGNRIAIKRPEPLPASVLPPDVPPPDIAMDSGLPSLVPPSIVPPTPPGMQIAQNRVPTPGRLSTPPTTWCCSQTKTTTEVPNVPEPGSIFLVCAGGLGMIAMMGRRIF